MTRRPKPSSTVEDHRHPFADGIEPHRHAEDTGLVDTTAKQLTTADIHTHDGTDPLHKYAYS